MYPDVSLKSARERRHDAKQLLEKGIDPVEYKKEVAAKAAVAATAAARVEVFEFIAREWFQLKSVNWADSHSSKVIRRLELDLFPYLGGVEIAVIRPHQLLHVLRRVEARGTFETAHRILQSCGQIWRYAVAIGCVERDITSDLRGALSPVQKTHLGAIVEPLEVCKLLRNIDACAGSEVVRLALKLAP
ncbi:MAG: integrase arm-type DNA-binding domain-containing protein, partial [Gallionellaceae bacterium]